MVGGAAHLLGCVELTARFEQLRGQRIALRGTRIRHRLHQCTTLDQAAMRRIARAADEEAPIASRAANAARAAARAARAARAEGCHRALWEGGRAGRR